MFAQLVKAAMRMRFDAPPREFWAVLDAYGAHCRFVRTSAAARGITGAVAQ